MNMLKKVDELSMAASTGKAVTLALSANDQFECLRKEDIAATLHVLYEKFTLIEKLTHDLETTK